MLKVKVIKVEDRVSKKTGNPYRVGYCSEYPNTPFFVESDTAVNDYALVRVSLKSYGTFKDK